MFYKIILGILLVQFVVILNLHSEISTLKSDFTRNSKTSENTLLVSSVNEVNERLKIVEEGIPELTTRNIKAKIIKDIIKNNIKTSNVDYFKSDRELNEYAYAVLDSSDKYKIPVSLILAVGRAESNFNARAISKTKAKGIMQIVDTTFDFCSKNLNKTNSDVFYVKDSVSCGSFYLRYLLNIFKGDVDLAVKGYNVGFNYILKFNGENLPQETQDYHVTVMRLTEAYKSKMYWEK